jgi:hypothetical protein
MLLMFPEVLGPFWAHAHRAQDRCAVVKGLEMYLPMSGSEPDPLLEGFEPTVPVSVRAVVRSIVRQQLTFLYGIQINNTHEIRHVQYFVTHR